MNVFDTPHVRVKRLVSVEVWELESSVELDTNAGVILIQTDEGDHKLIW